MSIYSMDSNRYHIYPKVRRWFLPQISTPVFKEVIIHEKYF